MAEQETKIFWGYTEVSQALGVSEKTVRRMVQEGRFPSPAESFLPMVKWSKTVILKWVKENE